MLETRSSRAVALLVAAASLIGLIALVVFVGHEPTPQDDDLIYEKMAQHPFAPHTYVFAYRVAVPWLVHVLPFSTDVSFAGLGFLMSAAAGGCMVLLLEQLGTTRRVAVLLSLTFALSPPLLTAALRLGRNPDPMTLLVMTAGTLFIVQRRAVPLALTMFAGAFNRESSLFLAPLAYALWAVRPVDRGALRRTIAVTAPALIAFVTLRLAIPTVGPGYGSVAGGRLDLLRTAAHQAGTLARRLATVYGPLWLVAPLALREFRFARRGLVLVPLCLIAFTFALDWGRVAAIGAPVVYGAAGWVLTRRPRLVLPTAIGCVVLVLGYAIYMRYVGLDHLLDARSVPYPVR